MKKEKTLKHIPAEDSKEMTPKKKQGTVRQWKELCSKMQEALRKIQQKMNQFLISNFSLVLESTFDISIYYQKVTKLLEDCGKAGGDTLGGLFKKIKSMIEPITTTNRTQKPSRSNHSQYESRKEDSLAVRLQKELSDRDSYIFQLESENGRIKQSLKQRLSQMEQNRQKHNRMTELVYILRKKGIDIDQIYSQNCQTPCLSKKTSALQDSSDEPYDELY